MTTSNAVEVFQFPATGQEIRTVVRDDEPWFVAADVCAVLDIANARDAVRSLDDDEQDDHAVGNTDTLIVKVISEPGLYSLILRSRKAEAKTFKRWVTHEVLPAIRKTGRFETAPDELEIALRNVRLIEEKRAALARAEIAEDTVFELTPKAEQADFHRSADGLISVQDFANKVKAWAKENRRAKVLHVEVWDFLGQIGLLIRGKKLRNNQPTAFATDRGFVKVKETEYVDNDGFAHTSISPRLTPAGEGWAWDRAVRRIAEHGSLAPDDGVEKRSA